MKKGIILGLLLLISASSQAGMLICNRFSCEEAYSYDPQEVLDVLSQMFSSGKKELLFCEADKDKKTCYNRPITFSGRTNWMSVDFQIPFARIHQVELTQGVLGTVLDYQVQTNRYYPVCTPSDSSLSFSVSRQGDFSLNSSDFSCRITELGDTKIKLQFILDYLDLEKGRLGGTYRATAEGDVVGAGSGYALLELSEQRSVELPRPVPVGDMFTENYNQNDAFLMNLDQNTGFNNGTNRANSGWNIKEAWERFKTKFMKILYLEPTDD